MGPKILYDLDQSRPDYSVLGRLPFIDYKSRVLRITSRATCKCHDLDYVKRMWFINPSKYSKSHSLKEADTCVVRMASSMTIIIV